MAITQEQQDLRSQLLAPEPTESQQALRTRLLGIQRPEGQDEVMDDLPYAIQDGVFLEDLLSPESRGLFKQRLGVASDPNFIRDKHVASLKIARDNNISFEDAYILFDDYAKTKYEGNSKAAATDLKKQLGESVVFSRQFTEQEIKQQKIGGRLEEIKADPVKAFPEEFHILNKPLNSKEWEQVRGRRRKPITPLTGDPFFSPVPKGFYKMSRLQQVALTIDARAKLLPEGDLLKERYTKWKSRVDLRASLLAAPFEEVERREKVGIFKESVRGFTSGLIEIASVGLELFGERSAGLGDVGLFTPEQIAIASKALKKFAQQGDLAAPEGGSMAFQIGRVGAQIGAGLAGATITGNPLAFGIPLALLENKQIHEGVLEAGGTDEQAELAAFTGMVINYAIEQWTFKSIRGFASASVRNAIKTRANSFAFKNALQFTGNLTKDTVLLLAENALQEGMQSTVSGGIVAIFDPTSLKAIPKQALMEAYYGAVAGLVFGGLGRVKLSAQQARQNIQTRKALVELDEALVEDTGVAPVRATEIVNNAIDLSQKATGKDEAAEIFLDSVNDQLGTEEAIEQVEEKTVSQEIAETERFEVVEPAAEAITQGITPAVEVGAKIVAPGRVVKEGIERKPTPSKGLIAKKDLAEKGKIVAFHGTRADFDTFRPLSHFGTEKAAGRALESVKGKGEVKIISVELTLKNPLEVKDTVGVQEDVVDWIWQAEGKGVVTEEEATAIENIVTETGEIKQAETEFIKLLKSKGYDGLKYINKTEDKGSVSYVIFDPAQALPAQPVAEEKFQVIDNETGVVLTFDTKAKAEAKVRELRQEQAGGIAFEKIQWKRQSGETVDTTRGELTTELNRLTDDLETRIADNEINTEEDVKQAEADWNDINSMRDALGYAQGEKPFKIIRAKGQEIRTVKNTKSRIWQAIKPKTASNLTTSQVISVVMKGMEKAARNAFHAGARDVVKNHKNLAGYAKARLKGLVVDNTIVNKLLSAVSGSRTDAEQVSAMAAIEVIAQRAEHTKAVSDLKKTVAFVNKKSGEVMQKKGIRPEFLERIQDVLNAFVFKKPSDRKIKGRKQTLQQRVVSLKKHLESLRSSADSRYNREFVEELLPTRLVESVDKLGLTSLEDMTAEEIDEINRDITSLLHQNATKNRLILERIARNAAEDINQMMAESENVVDKKLIEVGDETKPKPENVLQKTVAVVGGRFNHDLETLIDTLDGGQFGILHRNVAQNFSDGRRKRDAFFNELDTFVETEMDKAGITLNDLQEMSPAFYRMFKGKKGLKFRDKVLAKMGIVPIHKTHKVTLGGKRFNLTMAEIMSIYMHAQAKFNLISMLDSGIAIKDGVTDVISRIRDIDISEIEAIDKIVKSNPKALRLTEIAAETYDTIFKDEINRVSVSLKGIEIAREENYWHIQRYTGGGIAGTEKYRISLLESEGRLQKREGSGNPVRINDFFAQTLADRQAIGEYVGMAQAYRAAKTLLNYRPWREKMELKGYGDEIKKLDTIIERTEQAKTGNYDVISGFTGKLLKGLTRSVLGNPVIMASQYVSVHGYFTETDAKYITALKFLPFQVEVDRYRKNWTRYRTRMDGVVSSIALQELTGSDHALRVLSHKTDYINLIISGIHKVDMMAITEAGRITEAEMIDDNLGGKAKKYWDREGINPRTLEFESVEYWDAFNKRADYFVRRTQPMFDRENRSVLTGAETGLARSFVLFRSYIDQPLRIYARNQTALANNQISRKEFAQQTGLLLSGLYGYTMLRHVLDKLIYQDDDDVSDLMLEMIMSPAKLLTFVGFPLQSLAKKMFTIAKGEKESFLTPDFDTVATSFVDSVLKNSTEIVRGIGYFLQGEDAVFQSGSRAGQLKSSAYISDGVKGLFIDVLTLIGIPTRTASKIYDGWLKDNEEVFKI